MSLSTANFVGSGGLERSASRRCWRRNIYEKCVSLPSRLFSPCTNSSKAVSGVASITFIADGDEDTSTPDRGG